MFADAVGRATYNKIFGNMLYSFFGDMIFLRTMGYLYTILVVLIVVMLILLLLWKRKVKFAKSYAKKFLKETFWYKHLHGLVYVLWWPTFIVGMIKMKDYTSSTPIEGFSIFSSFLFMLSMAVFPIFLTIKLFRLVRNHPQTMKMLNKAYEYISKQEIVLDENSKYYFTHDEN